MIPARFVRPAKATDVKAPAIILPVENYDEPLLVVGAGENVFVCFAGENHPFEAMAQDSSGRWKGLAIENIEIELDLGSRYSLSGRYAITGSVVHAAHELQLIVRQGRGFRDIFPVVIAKTAAAASDGEEVGFMRWRAVVRDGERTYEVYTVDVTPRDAPDS